VFRGLGSSCLRNRDVLCCLLPPRVYCLGFKVPGLRLSLIRLRAYLVCIALASRFATSAPALVAWSGVLVAAAEGRSGIVMAAAGDLERLHGVPSLVDVEADALVMHSGCRWVHSRWAWRSLELPHVLKSQRFSGFI